MLTIIAVSVRRSRPSLRQLPHHDERELAMAPEGPRLLYLSFQARQPEHTSSLGKKDDDHVGVSELAKSVTRRERRRSEREHWEESISSG